MRGNFSFDSLTKFSKKFNDFKLFCVSYGHSKGGDFCFLQMVTILNGFIINKRPWTASPALINVVETGQNQFNMLIFFQNSCNFLLKSTVWAVQKLVKTATIKVPFLLPHHGYMRT